MGGQNNDMLNKVDNIPDGNYGCGNCAKCGFTTKSTIYTHPHSGKPIKICVKITYSTTNVVYIIK